MVVFCPEEVPGQGIQSHSYPMREDQVEMLEPKMKAPAFKLMDQDDGLVRLSQFKGQWVVLYFYPKDNTSG